MIFGMPPRAWQRELEPPRRESKSVEPSPRRGLRFEQAAIARVRRAVEKCGAGEAPGTRNAVVDALCSAINPPDFDLSTISPAELHACDEGVWEAVSKLGRVRSEAPVRWINLPKGLTALPSGLLSTFCPITQLVLPGYSGKTLDLTGHRAGTLVLSEPRHSLLRVEADHGETLVKVEHRGEPHPEKVVLVLYDGRTRADGMQADVVYNGPLPGLRYYHRSSAIESDPTTPIHEKGLNGDANLWCHERSMLWQLDQKEMHGKNLAEGSGAEIDYAQYQDSKAMKKRSERTGAFSRMLGLCKSDKGSVLISGARFGAYFRRVAERLEKHGDCRQFELASWGHWTTLFIARQDSTAGTFFAVRAYDPNRTLVHLCVTLPSAESFEQLGLGSLFWSKELTYFGGPGIRPHDGSPQPLFARLLDFESKVGANLKERDCLFEMNESHRENPMVLGLLAKGDFAVELDEIIRRINDAGRSAFADHPRRDLSFVPPPLSLACEVGAYNAVDVILNAMCDEAKKGRLPSGKFLQLLVWSHEHSLPCALDIAMKNPKIGFKVINAAGRALKQDDWEKFVGFYSKRKELRSARMDAIVKGVDRARSS